MSRAIVDRGQQFPGIEIRRETKMAKQILYSEPASYFPKEIRDKYFNTEKEKRGNNKAAKIAGGKGKSSKGK